MARSSMFKAFLASTFLCPAVDALANPLDGRVSAGSAGITTTPGSVVVNQQSQNAIIDWRSFNISSGEVTRFNQPGSTSTTLNRVTGGEGPSTIFGTLTANGRVFIVNPDGILFGKGSQVNVGGLLATTHDIANADFMAGRYAFTIPGNPNASIVNEGRITAERGGFAALVAPGVRNSGVITANLGTVALGAGNGVTLDFYGDQLINLKLDGSISGEMRDVVTGQVMNSAVSNSGRLKANGGTVQMTATTARRVVDSVVNNTGVIEANSVRQAAGKIILGAATASSKGAGAPVQTVKISGRLSAQGKKSGTKGGVVQVTGESIAVAAANIDASGDMGGGTVLIGGDTQGGQPKFPISHPQAALEARAVLTAASVSIDSASLIDVSATKNGNGGKAVIWSDHATSFAGHVSATGGPLGGDGGFVEVSSPGALALSGTADVTASKGMSGLFLIDPGVVNIVSSIPTCQFQLVTLCDDYVLAGSLSGGGNVFTSTSLNILAPINSTGSLFLNSLGLINIGAPVSSSSIDVRTFTEIAVNAPISSTGSARFSSSSIQINAPITADTVIFGQQGLALGILAPGLGNVPSGYSYPSGMTPSVINLNASISGNSLVWFQSTPVELRTDNPFIHFTNWMTQSDVRVVAGSPVPENIFAHNIQFDATSLGNTKLSADDTIRFTAPSLDLGVSGQVANRVQANGRIVFDSSVITSHSGSSGSLPSSAFPVLDLVSPQVVFNNNARLEGDIGLATNTIGGSSNLDIAGSVIVLGAGRVPNFSGIPPSSLEINPNLNLQRTSSLALQTINDLTINGNISSQADANLVISGANLFLNGKIDVSKSSGSLLLSSTWSPGLFGSPQYVGIVAGPNGGIIGGTGVMAFLSTKVGSAANPVPVSVIPDAGANSSNFVACANLLQCSDTGTKILTSYSADPAAFANNVFISISQGAPFSSLPSGVPQPQTPTLYDSTVRLASFSIPRFNVVRFAQENLANGTSDQDVAARVVLAYARAGQIVDYNEVVQSLQNPNVGRFTRSLPAVGAAQRLFAVSLGKTLDLPINNEELKRVLDAAIVDDAKSKISSVVGEWFQKANDEYIRAEFIGVVHTQDR